MGYIGLSEQNTAELEALEAEIGGLSDRLAGVGCQTRQQVTTTLGKLLEWGSGGSRVNLRTSRIGTAET